MSETVQTGPKNITDAMLMAALKESAGVYSIAAKKLGCDRSNVKQRVDRSAELQAWCAQIDAEIVDGADAVIIDTISRRDTAGRPTKEAQNMAKWLQDHRLRKKGVLLRHSGPDGGAIPINQSIHVLVEYVDPNEDVI